jgi:hypothetical protein
MSEKIVHGIKVSFLVLVILFSGSYVFAQVVIIPQMLTLPGRDVNKNSLPVCERPIPPEGCIWEGPDVYPKCSAHLVCGLPTS